MVNSGGLFRRVGSRIYNELQPLLNRKFALELLLLLLALSLAVSVVPLFKLCSDSGVPVFTCHTLKAKIGLISAILITLGLFLVIRHSEKGPEQNIAGDTRLFFSKIGVSPIDKKKESILFGAVVAVIAYKVIYPASGVREDLPVGWMKMVNIFSSLVLAPVTEEIVYRGMFILGFFNLAMFAYKKMGLEVSEHLSCLLLIILFVASSIAFMGGHSNPKTLYSGFIYGTLFLIRRNILMAVAGHFSHNTVATLYEYGIVEPIG